MSTSHELQQEAGGGGRHTCIQQQQEREEEQQQQQHMMCERQAADGGRARSLRRKADPYCAPWPCMSAAHVDQPTPPGTHLWPSSCLHK